MLPFDQILKSYGSMMKVKYEPIVKEVMHGKITFEMTAREAQLVLLRIREQGGMPEDGLLIPVWIFYGNTVATDETGDQRYFSGNIDSLKSISTGNTVVEGQSGYSPFDAFYDMPATPEDNTKLGIFLAINAIDGSIIDLDKGY